MKIYAEQYGKTSDNYTKVANEWLADNFDFEVVPTVEYPIPLP
jgi:hypothetical protein